MADTFSTRLQRAWYEHQRWPYIFIVFAWLFQFIGACRRLYFSINKPVKHSIPVIVVGNISVGGTGKTPVIIALAKYFQQRNFKVGIVSRGYGSKAPHYPYFVTQESPVRESGDEALLMVKETLVPVVIGKNRCQAMLQLIQNCACNLVLSDDGLQHYALARDYEIAVIDGSRGLGNQQVGS